MNPNSINPGDILIAFALGAAVAAFVFVAISELIIARRSAKQAKENAVLVALIKVQDRRNRGFLRSLDQRIRNMAAVVERHTIGRAFHEVDQTRKQRGSDK